MINTKMTEAQLADEAIGMFQASRETIRYYQDLLNRGKEY